MPSSQPTLAIDGGTPVRGAALPPWPHYPESYVEAVAAVLRSGKVNYWTGEHGRLLEQEYAAAIGRRYGIAVANGTLALELALHGLRVGEGDEVIVPSRTFLATASCAVMRGAVPVCADIDRNSQNLTAASIAACLTPKTKAIIAVHLAGLACDMDPILDLARRHGLKVIEDCAQANGARYKGRPVGSFGDAAAFSFCQDKIITTGGEGGMVFTDQEDVWRRAWSYKDHGKEHDLAANPHGDGGFRWLHQSFGSNWRLTEMQSAIGRLALRDLEQHVERRRDHAAELHRRLGGLPGLRLFQPGPDYFHAYYKFYVFVCPERLRAGWSRDRIRAAISAEGIPCMEGSCGEIYREAAFPPAWRPTAPLRVARELAETSLMFQVHPTLDRHAIEDTAAAAEKVMAVASQ